MDQIWTTSVRTRVYPWSSTRITLIVKNPELDLAKQNRNSNFPSETEIKGSSLDFRKAVNVRNTAFQWLSQFKNFDNLQLKVSGDPFYAYFLVKHLLWTLTSFDFVLNSTFSSRNDFLTEKYRSFVCQASEMNFSNLASVPSTSYPNSFIDCETKECLHKTNNTLASIAIPLAVSVVIPTRNVSMDWLATLFNQIQGELREDDEVILVDDNDDVLDYSILLRIIPDIKIIRGNKLGVSDARNLGVIHASKDLILFVDSDDEIRQGFINLQRKFHEKFENVSATGTWLQSFGAHDRVYAQYDGIAPLSVLQCTPPAGILMWKSEALRSLGSFKESFARGFEDHDLVARAISHNHLIIVCDQILYDYRRGHTSLTQSLKADEQKVLNELVWLNAQDLCPTHFINLLRIALDFGPRLLVHSIDLIFFRGAKVSFRKGIGLKLRNVPVLRALWSFLPSRVRIILFNTIFGR